MSLFSVNGKRVRNFFVLLALAVLIAGCAGAREQRIMDDARRFSAVTRVDPSFRPAPDARLVWYSDIIVQDQGAAVPATSSQVEVIRQAIESTLVDKGYQLTDTTSDADYMVAAALVMDESTESQQINELVRIYPGLSNSFNNLDAGTLMVVITEPTDPRTATLLW